MKNKITEFAKHPLLSGSIVMIVGSNMANLFAMIYHFIIGRLISVSDYGDLAALIALVGFGISIFSFLNIVVPKFVSAAKNERSISEIVTWFLTKSAIFSVLILAIMFVFAPILSSFFKIDGVVIYLLGPIFATCLLTLVLRASLQGMLNFFKAALTSNIEMAGRVVFGSIFVLLGLNVFGAVLGVLAANTLTVLVLLLFLKKYIKLSKTKFKIRDELLKYSFPAIFYSMAITSFISVDVILAKHFLGSYDAGLYSSLSTLGKIVLYGSSPVGLVMFPLISKKHAKGENYIKVFLLSFMLIVGVSIVAVSIFAMFPSVVVGILYGSKYLVSAHNLFWFSLYSALLGVSTLISSFFMSINKTKVSFLVILSAIAQIVGIWLFHGSILEIIKISILCVSLLLVTLLTYVGYELSKQNGRK